MNKRWLKALLFVLLFALARVDGVELKAIYLIDSYDPSIGVSARSDLAHMRSFTYDVADQLDINLKETILAGRDHTYEKAVAAINNLEVNEDDIVIFYFSGHGYRTDSKEDQWPALFFNYNQPGLDFNWAINTLKAKKPRFFLAIAEACNNVIDEQYAPAIQPRMAAKQDRYGIQSNFKSLFLDYEGSIVVATSKPGEFAWGTDFGGLYTTAFIQNLYIEIREKYPSWESILQNSYEAVLVDEEPIYELNLS
jgi:hypothetical protein